MIVVLHQRERVNIHPSVDHRRARQRQESTVVAVAPEDRHLVVATLINVLADAVDEDAGTPRHRKRQRRKLRAERDQRKCRRKCRRGFSNVAEFATRSRRPDRRAGSDTTLTPLWHYSDTLSRGGVRRRRLRRLG